MTAQHMWWHGSIGDGDAVPVAIPFSGVRETQATSEGGRHLLRLSQRLVEVTAATTIDVLHVHTGWYSEDGLVGFVESAQLLFGGFLRQDCGDDGINHRHGDRFAHGAVGLEEPKLDSALHEQLLVDEKT